jgi:hypothetical protein
MVEQLTYGYIPLMSATTSRLSLLTTTMKVDRRPWSAGRAAVTAAVALDLVLAFGHAAKAQYINSYFPVGVPGYDTNEGVTVLSRERPLYTASGVNAGSFIVKPRMDESFGFDSDPSGIAGGGSSTFLRTSPGVAVNSNWSQNSLGLSLSADNYHYFDLPQQDYTNWTASVGGGYTIGRSQLTLGYSHLSLFQHATDVGAIQSSLPLHYSVDDVRTGYTFDLGRISLSPSVDVQYFKFDNAAIGDQTISQSYRDRLVFTGGLTARYSLSDQRSLVLIVQGLKSSFTDEPAGQPTNDSTGVLALGGIDYQADGPWTYRLLAGVEQRSFSASQYQSRFAPIVAANVVWTPTGLTTVTGLVSRTIESPAAQDSSGFTYTNARLVLDHELYRNILLQARAGFQLAEYLQGGGSQTSYTLGGSVNYLINRNVRVSLDYNHSQLTGSQVPTFNGVPNATSTTPGSIARDVALISLHFAM